MYHCLFIHSPPGEHLAFSQVLAITSKAAINIHIQVLYGLKCSTALGKWQGAWLLDHRVRVYLVLQEPAKMSSNVAVPFGIPTSNE